MILYLEKRAKQYKQAQIIRSQFKNATVIEIDNYKNVFDKNTAGLQEKKSIIIAKLESSVITPAPEGYGHTSEAYFFKTSLNCVYDCSYCFLKGAFKTEHMVFFINYDDIKAQISSHVNALHSEGMSKDIWMYSSDYSDIQGMESISGFNKEFIPYFETLSGVKMEIRTKSGNIQSLLQLGVVPKNTEIAFSLNPQELIDSYESKTASLQMRIKAINTLLNAGWNVGLRLLPLLPVKNYKQIYSDFFTLLQSEIDISRISSSFSSGLLFTKKDYNTMLKKYPNLDVLHLLSLEEDNFYRESKEIRNWFYSEIKKFDKRCMLCLEN